MNKEEIKPTALDLFSGPGGFSKGLEMAGFEVLLGLDFSKDAVATYNSNFKHQAILGDITKISSKDLLKVINMKKGELFLIHGSPPCQGFSQAGKRKPGDNRNLLYKEFVRIVKDLLPQWVTMENVWGLTWMRNENGGKFINDILSDFSKLGYKMEWRLLNAADFGVPQTRQRTILIGNRIGKPIIFPETTHNNKWVTSGEVLKDIEILSDDIPNHKASNISAINLERIKHLKEGQWAADLPIHLQPEKCKPHNGGGEWFYGRCRRIDSKLPGRTITSVAPLFHYKENRHLTVRENARLQSFSDDFIFQGSLGSTYRQVGDAVPPLLAKVIGDSIIEAHST